MMINDSRTYRSLVALLSVVVALGVALPAAQHACAAMADEQVPSYACCCEMHAQTEAPQPCDDVAPAARDGCCAPEVSSDAEVPAALRAEQPPVLLAALPPPADVRMTQPHIQRATLPLRRAPASSVALHLLLAVWLN